MTKTITKTISKQGELKMENNKQLPRCPLIGADSNVFNLIGITARTLKENGLRDEAAEMRERVMGCGSYDEALAVMMEYVEPVSADEMYDEPYEDIDITQEF
jgi:hypothetical protein